MIQGESVTRMLLGAAQNEVAVFPSSLSRHRTRPADAAQAEAFLVERGYRIAPITLDGWDWMFAGLYEDAKKRNDTACSNRS